jgi:hypothetical protein
MAGHEGVQHGRGGSQLKAKSEQTDELNKKLVEASADLKIAQTKVEAESKRAAELATRAAELDRQVVVLRSEADELRALSVKLVRQAAELLDKTQPPAIVANTPWEDFAQRDPTTFDVVASDGAEGVAASDTSRVRSGRQSLRVTSDSSGLCVTYPKSRNANWDLSDCDYLTFAVGNDNPDAKYSGLVVRIGRGSQVLEYAATWEALLQVPKSWAPIKIPFPAGDDRWIKKEMNPLNLKHVDWIELHFQTSSPKLTLWLDDLSFGADPRRRARTLVPDPDRAAAEYVVAMRGEASVWSSGRIVTRRTLSDIPKEPFTLVGIYLGDKQDVTDDSLKPLQKLTNCGWLDLSRTKVSDKGLEYLKGIRDLESLNLGSTRVVGSGLRYFANHPKLSSLNLESTAVLDDGIIQVAAIPKLNQLVIRGTKVTDEAMRMLSTHANLNSVDISATGVSENGLQHLKQLPAGLQHLAISTTSAPSGLADLRGVPLRHLSVDAARTSGNIDDAFLISLQGFQELSEMTLLSTVIDERLIKRLSEIKALPQNPWVVFALVSGATVAFTEAWLGRSMAGRKKVALAL